MRSLSHPNIVKYFELDESSRSDKIYLFMELADCSLEEGLPSPPFAPKDLSMSDAAIQQRTLLKNLSRQVLQTLDYLQSVYISHHDIKPANILCKWQPQSEDESSDNIIFKLADFGVAERYGGDGNGCRSFFGTPSYQAPEVVRNVDGSPFDGIKADIWSLGVTLYQLVHGKLPFQGETVYLVMKSIDEDEIEFPSLSSHGSRQLKGDNELLLGFMRLLLTKEVSKRPSVAECLAHPWLQTTDLFPPPPQSQLKSQSISCCKIV